MGFLDILGAVSGIAGTVGKGKSKEFVSQQISGYQSLEPEQKKFAAETLFPALKDYFSTPYQGQPKRALDTTDTDPIFGSQRRVAYDRMAMDAARKAQAPAIASPSNSGTSVEKAIADYLTNNAREGFLNSLSTPRGWDMGKIIATSQKMNVPWQDLAKTLQARYSNGSS